MKRAREIGFLGQPILAENAALVVKSTELLQCFVRDFGKNDEFESDYENDKIHGGGKEVVAYPGHDARKLLSDEHLTEI